MRSSGKSAASSRTDDGSWVAGVFQRPTLHSRRLQPPFSFLPRAEHPTRRSRKYPLRCATKSFACGTPQQGDSRSASMPSSEIARGPSQFSRDELMNQQAQVLIEGDDMIDGTGAPVI